ncbi:MAG: UvrD-helicase domain-containing protein, partial [Verrucomicrobia bacterium]|nr:UvrD-helicase domain-containing protein [Verrucomicrobiota bacterium]
IAKLIESGTAWPSQVLAVTFTNKAAGEMKRRIEKIVGSGARNIAVGTFHSTCLRLLRTHHEKVGYGSRFLVYDDSDQLALIKEGMNTRNLDTNKVPPRSVLEKISRAKDSCVEASEYESQAGSNPYLSRISRVYNLYEKRLVELDAMDFGDLIRLVVKLFDSDPDLLQAYQHRWKYIMVDEYQDTNHAQYRLIGHLASEHKNLCVVGDDDQSIYGWRGAQVANILQFERFFPNPKIIRLEENYRSTQAVLEVANSLIRHNVGRREKKLRPTIPGGDLVRLVSMPGDQEESEWIVSEIVMQREEGRVLEDFAILFRTNGQIRKMEEVLREEKIPYRMVGAQSFYDRKEVRDVLSYVQVLNQPELDIPLLRILNTPPRGIGNTTSMAALDWSREKDQSIWETLIDGDFLVQVSKKVRSSIQTFTGQVEEVRRSLIDGVHAGIAMDQWLREMDFHEWLMRQCKTDKEKDARREGVSTTIASLTEAIKKGKSLNDFLDQAALDGEKEDDLEKKSGVTLITLHAVKGLEYPIVYLVGLEEGILPHKRSLEEGTRDEERRLLYVGITRAQEKMTMTYCATRVKWGKEEACEASSFIRELNPDWVHEEGYEDIMGAEASEEELRGFFSAMSAILDE